MFKKFWANTLFVVIALVGWVPGLISPSVLQKVALIPDEVKSGEGLYRPFTYSFFGGHGLLFAMVVALSILLSGILIGDRIKQKVIFFTVIIGVILAGLAFILVQEGFWPFLGPVPISWVYAGFALVIGLSRWKGLKLRWKCYVVVLLLAIASMLFEVPGVIGLQVAALVAGVVGALINKRIGPNKAMDLT